MKFRDLKVFKEDRISVGIEEESGKHYLSFPATNGMIDYEEYYEITKEEFDKFITTGLAETRGLVDSCRSRNSEDRLLYQPSKKRGSPC
jgi:hypothetical protein